MSLVIALAWRNLWRQRRRSLVTAGAVGAVVLLSVAYFALGGAAENGLYQTLTERGGHVIVTAPGARDATRFDATLIRDADPILATVRREADAALPAPLILPTLDVPALLSGDARSRGVALHGQPWPDAARARRLDDATLTGRFLEASGEIVLGASLARALDVAVGDEVVAYAPGGEGYGVAAYALVGTVDLADPGAEIAAAWTTLEDAQALAAPGAVQRIEVHGTSLKRIDQDRASGALAATLAGALPDLQVEDWRTANPATQRLLDALDPLMFAVSILFFVLAGLLMLNTVYLSVMERIREFGVLHALGAGDLRVLGMIATESILLAGVGAAVGTAGGVAFVSAYADGVRIPGLESYYASFGLDPVFYLSVEPSQVAFAIGFAVLTAVLAAVWPAWIAARIEPVDAMRFQA